MMYDSNVLKCLSVLLTGGTQYFINVKKTKIVRGELWFLFMMILHLPTASLEILVSCLEEPLVSKTEIFQEEVILL